MYLHTVHKYKAVHSAFCQFYCNCFLHNFFFLAITNSKNENITYLRPEEVDIKKGTKVRVHGGVFDGTEGYFVKLQGKRSRRVVMLIEGITAVALTEISTDFIEVLGQ